jgi:hypothetical protein
MVWTVDQPIGICGPEYGGTSSTAKSSRGTLPVFTDIVYDLHVQPLEVLYLKAQLSLGLDPNLSRPTTSQTLEAQNEPD